MAANWLPFYTIDENVDGGFGGLYTFTENEALVMSFEYGGFTLLYLFPCWMVFCAVDTYLKRAPNTSLTD
ncbi:MAG: hypothetical protein ACSHX8_03955 [Opitutaceae bacterium]